MPKDPARHILPDVNVRLYQDYQLVTTDAHQVREEEEEVYLLPVTLLPPILSSGAQYARLVLRKLNIELESGIPPFERIGKAEDTRSLELPGGGNAEETTLIIVRSPPE